jgi:hypothetical protein
MDYSEFHQLMQDIYAKREQRHARRLRILRIWLLCSATLLVLVLSLSLAYLRAAGK